MLPSIYLGSLILGGLLIGASIVLGGDSGFDNDVDTDADFGGDLELEVAGAADGNGDLLYMDSEAGAWLPFLSMRFWTFGLASFGLTGSLFSLSATVGMANIAEAISLGVSISVGVVVGWATSWAFQKLKSQRVTGEVGLQQLKGCEATVLLSVNSEKNGKIRTLVGGQTVDLLASSLDEHSLERGSKVLIVDIKDGIAMVTQMDQITGPPP